MNFLHKLLKPTGGNLNTRLAKLESSGYVKAEKAEMLLMSTLQPLKKSLKALENNGLRKKS